MVTTVKRIEGPAPAPAAANPDQVERLEDIAVEIEQEQRAGETAGAQASQAQQKAEQREQQAEIIDAARQVAEMLKQGRDMLADFCDELGALPKERTLAIWTDKRIDKLAGPLVQVVALHDEQIGPVIDKYGPYVMLLAAAAMPTVATVKAVRAHRALPVEAREVKAGAGGG